MPPSSAKGKTNRPRPLASDRLLRSHTSLPEPSIADLSPLTEVPSSPDIPLIIMTESNDISDPTPENIATAQPLVPPPPPEPQSQPGPTSTAPATQDESHTASLVLAALLRMAESQDTILQHIRGAQQPLPTQPQLVMPPLPSAVQPESLPAQPLHQPPVMPPQPSTVLLESLPAHPPPQQPFSTSNASPDHPPAPQQLPMVIPAVPTGFPGGLVPPAINTGNGAYSLQTLFPDIEESLLLAIGRHSLRPGQLSKLDTRLRDKQLASNLEYENGILVHKEKPPSSKDFPTFESLHYPLQRYFSVLQAHVGSTSPPSTHIPLSIGCNDYISLLNVLHLDYEWSAVLNYHFAVHAIRLSEMAHGNYSQWGRIDTECQNRYLVGRARARSTKDRVSRGSGDNVKNQTCNDFNFRTCYRERCQRLHKCRNCDSTDHGVSKCPKKTS